MTKLITLAAFLLIGFRAATAQPATHYFIELKDKGENVRLLEKPSAFLSEKAIKRRRVQNITISANDLPVSNAYLSAIKASGVSIANASRWLNIVTITTTDPQKIDVIKALDFVKSVREIHVQGSSSVKDKFIIPGTHSITVEDEPTRSSSAAGLNYGLSHDQANQIGAVCMHNLGFQGQGMVIAVLDAGFYKVDSLPAFDSLRMNNQLLGTRDFVTGDTMVYEDYQHGMNVLSCMVGNLPGRIVGTAPKASYWLLRTEDSGSESLLEEMNWAVAAEFADSVGADIINSSLGYHYFDNAADNHTFADMDGNTTIVTKAADIAASKGIFVTSSAGNSGGPPWFKITAPADADSILTVGAVDSMGFLAGFSSRGPTSDGRIKPNTVAKGVQAIYATGGGDIAAGGGTSFSSPVTAGAVACLWQANPGRTNMQLIQAIQQSANQAAFPDTLVGYGIPNFCTANLLLSVNDPIQQQEQLTVFPNPFSNDLQVSFYSAEKQTLIFEIFDMTGRLIRRQELAAEQGTRSSFRFSADHQLPSGIYMLRMITMQGSSVKKIIKN